MPIRHALWKVSAKPTELSRAVLPSEETLREMIIASPSILSDEWMLIGREVDTGICGRLDLLAIAPDGALVLIELKRSRTPRDVVAQALDYACWVDGLQADDIAEVYGRFAPGRDLAADFLARFGQALDEDSLNNSHQIVVVASSLDSSTERIINYLSERDIAINVLFFEVFQDGSNQLLSRAWLIDPAETQTSAATPSKGAKEPWNGEFYACFGDGTERSWENGRKFGFISAGGGAWYSNTLNLVSPGDRVWVKVPGRGFVGVGLVRGKPLTSNEFKIEDRPALEILTAGYHRQFADDPERAEYFVPIEWLQTVPLEQAVQEVGMFGNQNTVCKPKTPLWRTTVDRLKLRFPQYDRHTAK